MNPFLVVLLYDKEGYYTSVRAESKDELLKSVEARTSKIKGLVACSLPFNGKWVISPFNSSRMIQDISLPEDWKANLSHLEGNVE